MILLTLDEYGKFEDSKNATEPVMVAGLLYDDKGDKTDFLNERNRIKKYYEMVIASVGGGRSAFEYPSALHSTNDRSRNSTVVGPVKTKVNETICKFLREGTYGENKVFAEKERKGEYYVFTLLKSEKGKELLIGNNINKLINDNYAANLYLHMTKDIVNRVLFHNPLIDNMSVISTDIATRVSENYNKSDAKAAQHKSINYKEMFTPQDTVFFSITNADVYRTEIADEILKSGKEEVRIEDFKVRKIDYQNNDNHEFLYLSDSICSFLQRSCLKKNKDTWLKTIITKVNELAGPDNALVFAYDEADLYYEKAISKYEMHDYYGALSIIFDASLKEDACSRYYKKKWFEKLKQNIIDRCDGDDFEIATEKLYSILYRNDTNQEKLLFIYKILDTIGGRLEERLNSYHFSKTMYMLYDIGVTAYCHKGDSKNARRCIKKCDEYAYAVGLEEYFTTRNKLVVAYCDELKLKKALDEAKTNAEYVEYIEDVNSATRNKGIKENYYHTLGRAYSQLGQVYAFMRNPLAEGTFDKAMQYFAEGSEDYKITQSYLIHYYIDNGLKEKFHAEAYKYFECKTYKGWLDYLTKKGAEKNPVVNAKYALYILIKGLFTFDLDEINDSLWKSLISFEKEFGKLINKPDWMLTEHPTEIIFKYMALIALSKSNTDLFEKYHSRIGACIKGTGPIVNALMMYGEIELLEASRLEKKAKAECISLVKYLVEADMLKEDALSMSYKEQKRVLDDIFIYMYR